MQKVVLYYNCKVKESENSFLKILLILLIPLIPLIPLINNYILKDIQNKLNSFTLYAYKNDFKHIFLFLERVGFL